MGMMDMSGMFGFNESDFPQEEEQKPSTGYMAITNQGWVCPKCGRVYSPTTSECPHCGDDKAEVATASTDDGEQPMVFRNGELEKEQPTPEWVPTSERLPDNDNYYIVSVMDDSGDRTFFHTAVGWYFARAEAWIVTDAAFSNNQVRAWMPLPAPYCK